MIGSSVALFVRPPRRDRREAPYARLLASRLPNLRLINNARGSFDVHDALKEFTPTVVAHDPDAVILHIGINECAPRFFPRRLWRALYNYPSDLLLGPTRRAAVRVGRLADRLARTRAAAWFNRPWFTPARFEALLDEWLGLAQKETRAAVIIVAIGPPSERVERSLPSVSESVRRYNMILERAAASRSSWVRYVDALGEMSPAERSNLQPDGIHLSAAGHRVVADAVGRALTEMLWQQSTRV